MTHGVDQYGLSGPVDGSRREPHPVVVLPDEVDLATTAGVLTDVRRCLAEHPERVIIDVSDVRFLGSTGISALLQAREQAEWCGVGFRLIGVEGNRVVRRVLTLAGVIGLFDLAAPAPGPRQTPGAHTGGVVLMFQEKPGRRGSELAGVTGGYCEEDTGQLRWVAVQPAGRGGHENEWLVPAGRIVVDGDRFFVALAAEALWGAPTVSGAPQDIGDKIEDRLRRYYADVVDPATTIRPTPIPRSAGHCYRIPDVADALAQLMIHRRVVDCRSARWAAPPTWPQNMAAEHDCPTIAD